MRQTTVFFISQRRQYAKLIQGFSNLSGAHAIKLHAVNVAHDAGRIFIRHKLILVVLRLSIAVNRARAYIFAVLPFNIDGGARLDGNVPAVGIVDDRLDGYHKVIAVIMERINAISESDKADTISRKNAAQIAPGFDVLTAKPG